MVGTPGRILDLHRRYEDFKFNKLEVLVLDEADMLLDMGFKDSINQILSLLPKQRRTGLFSATQTKEVKDLVRAGMRNPVSISVRVLDPQNVIKNPSLSESRQYLHSQQMTPITLSNYYIISSYENRPGKLVQFIQNHQSNKTIVFCATCACVDYYSLVFDRLRKKNIFFPSSVPIYGFHGKMVQKKRNLVYKKFVSIPFGVLFTTDVAARGIDIPDVDWIVQLAAPKDPAFFVHRVGRTARAGKSGGALLFISQDEFPYVYLLHGRGIPLVNMEPSDNNLGKLISTNDYHHEMNNVQVDQLEEDIDEHFTSLDESGPYEHSQSEHDEDDENATIESSNEIENINTDNKSDEATIKPENNMNSESDQFYNQVLEQMKRLAIEDRTVLEAGSTAFMSFLRAYKEHLCSYIFKFDKLDLGSIARMYALLRLPKIPETRGIRGRTIQFETSDVDTSKIKYLHKQKEIARKRKIILLQQQKSEECNKDYTDPGNDNTKETSTRVSPDQYEPPENVKRVRNKKKNRLQVLEEEWDDLAVEEATYKKFKKGKVTSKQYEKMLMSDIIPSERTTYDDDDDDDDDGSSHSERDPELKHHDTASKRNVISNKPRSEILKVPDEKINKLMDFWSKKTTNFRKKSVKY